MSRPARPADPHHDHRFDPVARAATYGPAYPTGWYRIGASGALSPGQVRAVDALGKHLALYRTADGQPHLVDARCPHQGASLAGGCVDGGGLRCPFHKWRFDENGLLDDIPGLDRTPRARVRSHPVVEAHGIIWAWHHVSGRRSAPDYPFVPVAPIVERGMVFRGEHHAGTARMHLREFCENSVDFQHFVHVHDGLTVPWTTHTIPGFRLHHDPAWRVSETEPHVAYFENDSATVFRGRVLEKTRSFVRVTMYGPGGAVWFHFQIPELGELVLFETHLPKAPLEQETIFRWYADPGISRLMAWIIVGQWVANWKADLPIWENKVFVERPVLVGLDGPVRAMRRWYAQFLGEEAASGQDPRPAALASR
jgi:cholesterol 7-dehydrogenase